MPAEQTLIASILLNGNRFRWVDCQMQSLRECIMLKDLREALTSLPETLSATYARVLENINPRCYKHAMKVLKFLTVSPRPVGDPLKNTLKLCSISRILSDISMMFFNLHSFRFF
jgi:hypothetical protein